MIEEEIKQRNESKEFLKDLQYYLFQNKRSPKIDKLYVLLDNDEKRINELEKENAELKSRDCWKSCEYANPKTELIGQHIKDVQNLIKAKEIIKKFSEFVNNEIEYDTEHPQEHTDLWNELCEEAEQFINENSTYERIQKAKYNYAD